MRHLAKMVLERAHTDYDCVVDRAERALHAREELASSLEAIQVPDDAMMLNLPTTTGRWGQWGIQVDTNEEMRDLAMALLKILDDPTAHFEKDLRENWSKDRPRNMTLKTKGETTIGMPEIVAGGDRVACEPIYETQEVVIGYKCPEEE